MLLLDQLNHSVLFSHDQTRFRRCFGDLRLWIYTKSFCKRGITFVEVPRIYVASCRSGNSMFSWSQDLPQCWRLCCATGSPGVPTRQSKSMPDISTMSLGFPAAAPKNPRGIPQVYHCRGMWFGLGFGKLLQRWNPLRNPRFHWHQRIVSLPIRIYIYYIYNLRVRIHTWTHGWKMLKAPNKVFILTRFVMFL